MQMNEQRSSSVEENYCLIAFSVQMKLERAQHAVPFHIPYTLYHIPVF